jgi:Zonular occludens toxin (Zot).
MGLKSGVLVFRENIPPSEFGNEVIRRIIYNRIEMKKNCFFMLVGDSGEGKSYTALRIAEIVQEDFDPKTQVVYTPDQYLDVINYAVEKRKTKVIILDEAHVTIPARLWLSFTNLAVGLVTTTFRRLKSLAVLIVSPDINWVEKMVRESCNYYAICERKRKDGRIEYVYADVFKVLRNRYDIEKTKLI